jgi:MtN3 and saliva related transmembrane protein
MTDLQLQLIGYIAGFLTTVCMFPQLLKILITKSAKDVSIITFVVLILGEILWIIYGIYTNDLRITIPNAISCGISIAILLSSILFITRTTESNEVNTYLV